MQEDQTRSQPPSEPAAVESGENAPDVDSLDKERQYLEGLFNSRFNFYLVFVSLYFVAILQAKTPLQGGVWPVVLFVGMLASGVMFFAILRTQSLLTPILERLRDEKNNTAYGWAYSNKRPWGLGWEANLWLLSFPLATLLLLGALFVQALKAFV